MGVDAQSWLIPPAAGDARPCGDWQYGKVRVVARESVSAGWEGLWLEAPAIAALSRGGHFVMLGAESLDPYLKLPFYVARVDSASGTIQVIVRQGRRMGHHVASWQPGQRLESVGPLGMGFPEPDSFAGPLLMVGAGHGLAPLALAASAARAAGHAILVANPGLPGESPDWLSLAGPDVAELVPLGEPAAHLARVRSQIHSRVFPQVWAAGPEALLAAVSRWCGEAGVAAYVAVERHIACGVGTCLGCVVKAPSGGTWRSCVDGPVLPAGEVVLDD